jgi:CRISPR-associated protein Cas2
MSPDAARYYLIAYDVQLDPRRTRIAKHLESYGDRIQYSVFLIEAKPARLARLTAKLQQQIDPDTDSILICDLGQIGSAEPSRLTYLGRRRAVTSYPMII